MEPEQPQPITSDPHVLGGQPVLTGTRVPVDVILDCLDAGMTPTEITHEYPSVSETQVRALAARSPTHDGFDPASD